MSGHDGGDDDSWRTELIRWIVDFSARLHALMPIDDERLRQVLAAEGRHDRALRGAMASMHLNFDRALILIGVFISGGNFPHKVSQKLRGEIAKLAELGLVQLACSGSWSRGPSGLTRRGQQLAVYLIYRLGVAATKERTA